MARFPFVVAFAFTRDETNHFADVLLPDAGDLESLQLIRIGGSKYIEQFWDHEGFALRQPAIAPRGQARDFTDIATDLRALLRLLTDKPAINRALGVPLKDFSIPEKSVLKAEQIWDAVCKAASSELTGAPRRTASTGGRSTASPPSLSRAPPGTCTRRSRPRACASRCPTRSACCASAGARPPAAREGMRWWDKQLAEYQALPAWKDFPGEWEASLAAMGGDGKDYPFWLLTARSMQYAWAATSACSSSRKSPTTSPGIAA